MTRTLSASRMQAIGDGLHTLAGVLDQYVASIGATLGGTRTTTQDVFANWHGPRADAEYERADAYFDVVEQVPRAIMAQRDIVAKAASFAIELAGELATTERWLASTRDLLNRPDLDGGAASALVDDERSAISAIGTMTATWTYKCAEWFGEQFATGTRALQSAVGSIVTEYAGPPIPTSPEAYFGRIAVVVGNSELEYDWDDFGPAGELASAWATGATHVAIEGEFGNVIARAFDTGDEQNDEWDQDVERGDVEALTNPDVAASQIRSAAASLGYRLDEDTVQALIPLLVSQAWLTLATWGESSEAGLEERLEAWERRPAPRPSVGALAGISVLDVDSTEVGGGDSLGTLSLVADGAGAVASMLPEQLAAEAAAVGGSANGLSLVIIGASVVDGCGDGDNCAGAVAVGSADAALSLAFPVAWPMVKFSGWGILNAVGGMMEESPDLPASWPAMGAHEGQTPADAQRDDYEPEPSLQPNGGNATGQSDYGGPDCGALALYGLDDENPLCRT